MISAGVNYFGKALEEAAKETNDRVVANRNVELTAKTFGPCLQIVRGWFHRGFFSAEESTRTFTDATRTWVVADPSGPMTVDLLIKLWQRRMWLAAQPDFIFEARVVQTNATSPADATLLTLVPVFARLDVPISAAVLRPSKDRDVAVFFAFHKATEDPSAPGTANGGLSLGRLKPRVGLKFPPPISGTTNTPNRSSGESKWFTVALDTTTKPMTISALVSEHQDASAFLQFVSDVFTASKPAFTTAIQTAAIPSIGAAAEETDRAKAESARTTYEDTLIKAFTSASACAANLTDALVTAGDVRGKLRTFNRAPRAVGQPEVSEDTVPLVLDAARVKSGCTQVRDQLQKQTA